MTGFREYDDYDATGLAELVTAGDVSPAELLDETLTRIDRVNGDLNAVIRPMPAEARGQLDAGLPDGPFRGVPFLLKDLLADYAGVPLMSGSRYFRDFVPQRDSALVQRFKQAGAVICGKTATPEFGAIPITEPELTGPTRNPWNIDHTPNGSSGGSAAAVASGMVHIASAGDGGGSIRTPASACNLVGLKPTRGRNPVGPDLHEGWWGFVAEHVLTHTVRDSARMLDATAGSLPGALFAPAAPERPFADEVGREPGALRIAYSTSPLLGRVLHPDCRQAVEANARRLEALGHHVEEFTPPLDREEFIYCYSLLVASDLAATLDKAEKDGGRKLSPADFEPRTWALKRIGDAIPSRLALQAYWWMQRFAQDWCRALAQYDVFVCSTVVRPPEKIGGLAPDAAESLQLKLLAHLPLGRLAINRSRVLANSERIFDYSGMTMPMNVTGQPSLSLPLDMSTEGLPVGSLFTARHGDEATLFRLAAQLESEHPWRQRRPAVFAGSR